jgi:chorismate dehydratase
MGLLEGDQLLSEIRIGIVRYLNTKPLYYGLSRRLPSATFDLDLPSLLSEKLATDQLDVALIPSVEYLRGIGDHGYIALPGSAIGSQGPVRSVKLLSHVPLEKIHRLALDEGSRTSQALCRIWLEGVHGVQPEQIENLPIGVPPEESTADAMLVIGDRAMSLPEWRYHTVVDLGEAWTRWTGLPFVFALWVVKSTVGLDLDHISKVLRECKDDGVCHTSEIAAKYAENLGLSLEECVYYLTHQINYQLDDPELAGLRLFAAKAEAMGLVPERCEIVIHSSGNFACRG